MEVKKMKKLLAMLLVLAMISCLFVACANNDSETDAPTTAPTDESKTNESTDNSDATEPDDNNGDVKIAMITDYGDITDQSFNQTTYEACQKFAGNHLKHNLEVSGEELLVAKEKAEESNRLKTAFLANMSHEIRTPLNAIVGFSSVLVSDDSSPAEKEQYCDIIQKNSDLLLHLINDILDISRMESGRIKFVWEECDVVELCQTALSTVEYGRKTSALFLFETPVPSLVVKTDAQRLKQVLINLLSNAAKFTPSGSIKLTVAIDKQHQQLELSVSDTGCGIPPDKSEKVFERFEKLNEYSQGTGLGLAISRLIIENLGGKIWVDKDYTEGARFVFTHPLTKKE